MNAAPRDGGQPSSRHVAELDGIRGLAILAVIALHFICTVIDTPRNGWEHIVAKATGYGAWGVDLFFVLSGFLITGILYETRQSSNYFRSFYGRRTLRIFPLYYGVLLLLILLPVGLLEAVAPHSGEVRNVQGWLWTYLTNVHLARTGDFTIPYVSHFWSLAVEEHFYLFWPLVVRGFARATLIRICAVLAAGSVALRLGLLLAGVNEVATYTLTPCRLDALCIGAGFALWMRGVDADRARRLRKAMAWTAALTILLSAIRSQIPHDRLVMTVREGAVALFFGVFVASAGNPDGAPGWAKVLRARWLIFFGKYSYGLYVFHAIIAHAWERWLLLDRFTLATGSRGVAIALQAVLGIGLSILMAVASYQLYERRFLKLKRLFEAAPPPSSGREGPPQAGVRHVG